MPLEVDLISQVGVPQVATALPPGVRVVRTAQPVVAAAQADQVGCAALVL